MALETQSIQFVSVLIFTVYRKRLLKQILLIGAMGVMADFTVLLAQWSVLNFATKFLLVFVTGVTQFVSCLAQLKLTLRLMGSMTNKTPPYTHIFHQWLMDILFGNNALGMTNKTKSIA